MVEVRLHPVSRPVVMRRPLAGVVVVVVGNARPDARRSYFGAVDSVKLSTKHAAIRSYRVLCTSTVWRRL
jgi:hypothetical protein